MTVVIAIHLPDFAIIGANSRGTSFDKDGNRTYDETIEKIALTEYGLISAAGSYGFFQLVAMQMTFNATAPGDIQQIIQEQLVVIETVPGADATKALTRFAHSYVSEQGQLTLEHIHLAGGYELQAIPAGGHLIIAPAGMSNDAESALSQQVAEMVRGIPDGAYNERAEAAERIVRAVVRACFQLHDSVGPNYQIGLQHHTGARMLSEITDGNSQIIWQDLT